jgi:hypothetical protein
MPVSDPLVKVATFLRDQVTEETSAGFVERFELRHLPIGTKRGETIVTVDANGHSPGNDWFEAQTAKIVNAMAIDADGIGGVQKYVLLAFRSKIPERPTARLVHRMRVESDDPSAEGEGEGGFDSEGATKHGLLAQLMRHNEAHARTNAMMVQSSVNALERVVRRLSEQNDKLQEHRESTLELVEQLQSFRLERELETAKAEASIKMKGELLDEVKLLAPSIVNRLSGRNLLPEKADMGLLAVQRFVKSLSQEQIAKMTSEMTNDQQIALAELVQAANKT